MSYLEYTVKSVPTGFSKFWHLNWALIVLVTTVAGIGFLMLYSVAGGSFSPWAEPQIKRFLLGFTLMLIVAMVPIWFWRNIAGVAYGVSIILLLYVERAHERTQILVHGPYCLDFDSSYWRRNNFLTYSTRNPTKFSKFLRNKYRY